MLESYAIGLSATVLVAVAWLGVQNAWRRVFPSGAADADALAGRAGCHGCGGAEPDKTGRCRDQPCARSAKEKIR
jgi:hypothetical protein